LNNDHLTPTWVAEKLNISPGYLHMLFKEEDTSVSNWIKLSREELAEQGRKILFGIYATNSVHILPANFNDQDSSR
jgi:hypothetical protein